MKRYAIVFYNKASPDYCSSWWHARYGTGTAVALTKLDALLELSKHIMKYPLMTHAWIIAIGSDDKVLSMTQWIRKRDGTNLPELKC